MPMAALMCQAQCRAWHSRRCLRRAAADAVQQGSSAQARECVTDRGGCRGQRQQRQWVTGRGLYARRIARAVLAGRPWTSTAALAACVAQSSGYRNSRTHPATRTFQGLRIHVNDELGELERGLEAAEAILAPGGRLIVVTFHSLEDRIVKAFLKARASKPASKGRLMPWEEDAEEDKAQTFMLLNKKPLEAQKDECRANPRARSAKLRAATRTDVAAGGAASGARWASPADISPAPRDWSADAALAPAATAAKCGGSAKDKVRAAQSSLTACIRRQTFGFPSGPRRRVFTPRPAACSMSSALRMWRRLRAPSATRSTTATNC